MEQKEKIIEAIKAIASLLNEHNFKWLIGASGALLVYGLDIIPGDIDIVVDQNDYVEAKTILKDLLIRDTKVEDGTTKTKFIINGIDGDLLAHCLENDLLLPIYIDGVNIFVHQLQTELDYYKSRTDKVDANKIKIALIEKFLSAKSQ